MNHEIDGAVAIVTGAASGIGAATARLLASAGASVILADVNDTVEDLAEQLSQGGASTASFRLDTADPAQAHALVEFAERRFGRLDLAVNNAGITAPITLLHETELDDWSRVLAVNLSGVFYGLKYQIPSMVASGGGSIVNVSSILGVVGGATTSAYTAAKHGVTGLTKAAALGYATAGVRVNSVHPGYIDTPLLAVLPREDYDELTSLHPIGRLGTADEIAELIVFLLSPKSSFTTGAQFVSDGGFTAR